jgi:DNA processing protein
MNNLVLWFTLKSIPGIGNYTFKRLIEAFGSPESVFAAPRSQLLAIEGVSEKIIAAINARAIPDTVQKNLDICRQQGIAVITMNDPSYPVLLWELPDPPPYLYCSGKIEADAACIAIVGSRSPTRYGLSLARQLAGDLAGHGLIIISGLARGIDTAAHQGALDAKGRTYAVLGSGLARIYPPENRALAERIRDNGAVVSEFPVFAEPEPHHFPVRNRIISGISIGTIVVEAAKKSGSLITARLAAEQGRDVFAVPGSTQSAKSTGTHGLLKQGAQLVENAADVLEAIAHMLPAVHPLQYSGPPQPSSQAFPKEKLDKEESRVLKLLEPYPLHIDEIAKKAGLEPGKTAGILLQLELKGFINQEPGKRFLLASEAPIG